jgi:DNA polymerase
VPTPIQRNRGKLIPVSESTQVLVTVHPSYLLRIPQQTQAAEFERFVRDLKIAQPAVSSDQTGMHVKRQDGFESSPA